MPQLRELYQPNREVTVCLTASEITALLYSERGDGRDVAKFTSAKKKLEEARERAVPCPEELKYLDEGCPHHDD